MKRCSWLAAFVCLLSSSGAVAQQYRPVAPRYETEYPVYTAPSNAGGRPVRPVRFQEEMQLEDPRGSWNAPGPSQRPGDAAEASRIVADQLRQQYHSSANAPELQHAAGRGPVYYPSPTAVAPNRVADRPNRQPAEPIRYSRTVQESPGSASGNVAPGPINDSVIAPPLAPRPMSDQSHLAPGQPYGSIPPRGYEFNSGPHGYENDGGPCDDYSDYEVGGSYANGHDGRYRARRGSRPTRGFAGGAGGGDCGTSYFGHGDCGTGYGDDYGYEHGPADGGYYGPGDDCGPSQFDSDFYGAEDERRRMSGGSRFARAFSRQNRDVYTVVGARWLSMRRSGSDYKSLSYESAMPSSTLLVSDADLGYQSGVEAFLIRQDNCGQGWEGRYWGLRSESNSAILGNMPFTQLTGLSSIPIGTWGNVGALYNTADYHRVQSTSEFHSFEWNLLNHASVCANNNWLYRGILGIRVLRFRDALQYSAHSSTNFGFSFDQLSYYLSTRNTFVGFQTGGSGEYCVTDKLRLALGANAGVGAVFIDADQEISTSTGVLAGHPGGGSFSYMNNDSDLSVFGEFDARMYYHISCNWRLSCGYRLLGLTGVALAQDQIPYAFTSLPELYSVKRDGSLLLHGLTLGAEFSY